MSPEAERRPNENEGAAPKSSATTTVTSLQPAAEVVATSTLTEAEAARLTTKIQLRLDTIANNTELVIPMIEAAKNGNAHTALGYRSWTEYVAHRFGGALARLGKGERLPLVELLADQGMSTRAIASVVGVSKSTVADDLSSSGHLTAEPVAGRDGKSYTRPAPRLEFHWLGEHLLPIVASDQVVIDSIAQDLQVMGLIRPILLAADGRIFDGRLRYLACLAANYEPHFEMLSPDLTGTELIDRWLSLNVIRQHLTEDQRAFVAVKLEREWSA